jgi:enoyl-CoA hydratase
MSSAYPAKLALKSVLYERRDRIAYITLNRPERLNAIDLSLPSDLRKAVKLADLDDHVHVIVLQGAGRAFCAGYDLKDFAEKQICEFDLAISG